MQRSVRRKHSSIRDDIADLVTRRPFPAGDLDQIDPFLLLNHHGPQIYPTRNQGLPFGPHPHRGFETVTFILDGELAHRDSGGHESVIHAGGVQWMTAGRGLVHEEVSSREFMEKGGSLEILQLWVNLPARLKMTEPRYVGKQAAEIPAIEAGEGVIHAVSGDWSGTGGAFESLTDVTLAWITLEKGNGVVLDAPPEQNVLCYAVSGSVSVSGVLIQAFELAEMNADGRTIEIEARERSVILFGRGTPFRERVVAHGPFVMNSEAEIHQAIADYRAGLF